MTGKQKGGALPLGKGHILLVEARFYPGIADALAAGATRRIEAAGSTVERITVPGALEIPPAIALAADSGKFDGFVALGCVIRGETTHYDYVCGESARKLMDLAADRRLAIGNGILTVETEAQAWARAKPEELDKGGGAAEAALVLLGLRQRLLGGG